METVHQWSPWKRQDDEPCTFFRLCHLCGNRGTKFEHEWGDWSYLEDGKCLAERTCTKCGAEEREMRHQYERGQSEDWGYDECNWDIKVTTEYLKCRRCFDYQVVSSHSEYGVNL